MSLKSGSRGAAFAGAIAYDVADNLVLNNPAGSGKTFYVHRSVVGAQNAEEWTLATTPSSEISVAGTAVTAVSLQRTLKVGHTTPASVGTLKRGATVDSSSVVFDIVGAANLEFLDSFRLEPGFAAVITCAIANQPSMAFEWREE